MTRAFSPGRQRRRERRATARWDAAARQRVVSFFDAQRARGGDPVKATLLSALLETGVPLEIERLRAVGGPNAADRAFSETAGLVLASQADDLQFRAPGGSRAVPFERDWEGRLVFTPAFLAAFNYSDDPALSADEKAAARGAAMKASDLRTADLATILMRALAVMSFCPGGVTCLGTHFRAEPLPPRPFRVRNRAARKGRRR